MSSNETPVQRAAVASTESIEFEVTTTVSNYLTSTVLDNLINVTGQSAAKNFVFRFGWFDYGFFVGLLGLSAIIGIYYGFFSKHKQNTTAEYILGGRTMKIIPVATSMIATLVFNFQF